MKTLRQRILLGIVGVAVLAVLVVVGKKKSPGTGSQPSELPTANARVFGVDEWLDSCLKSCRPNAARRLGHLPVEKRERYCTVNCECGMEKMTEPGSTPHTVTAPSKAWLKLSDDDQVKAAGECQKRATAEAK